MNEDITFCFSDCKITKCIRNKKNIKHQEIPHSYAFLEGTDCCIKTNEGSDGDV